MRMRRDLHLLVMELHLRSVQWFHPGSQPAYMNIFYKTIRLPEPEFFSFITRFLQTGMCMFKHKQCQAHNW
jgi:hypothetical protein